MQNRKSLSLQIASAVALAMLFGTSAFAESRHQQRTGRQSGGRIERGHSSRSNGSYQPREHSVTQSPQRFEQRDSGRTWRNDSQRNNTQRNSTQRYESRNNGQRYESRRDNNSRGSNGVWRPESRVAPYRGQQYNSYGRVQRYERHRGGYRVWIGGGLYPIFVPFAHWRLHPLHVGLSIRFGGYWDPLGYWSVYDYSPYDGYYGGRYDSVYTRGEIRGVVESVDYRRGTLVINDDISRQFVTVTMPRDRRMDDVRSGDYVEFSGDWTRSGVFNAYRLERLEEGRD